MNDYTTTYTLDKYKLTVYVKYNNTTYRYEYDMTPLQEPVPEKVFTSYRDHLIEDAIYKTKRTLYNNK